MSALSVGSSSTSFNLFDFLAPSQAPSTSALSSLSGTGSTSSTGATSSPTGSSSTQGDRVSLSGPAQLLSQLQQLQSSNPTEFKSLTAQIASQLNAAAQQQTGPANNFLTTLASAFQSASTAGNTNALQALAQAAGEQDHHHHQGIGTYSNKGQFSPSSSSSGDPIQSLLQEIESEVTAALASSSTSSNSSNTSKK